MVTRESAKLLCKGSIPFRASNLVQYTNSLGFRKGLPWKFAEQIFRVTSSAVERFPDKKEAHGPTPWSPTNTPSAKNPC